MGNNPSVPVPQEELTVCGRPATNSYQHFTSESGGTLNTGDPNYGYVANCTSAPTPQGLCTTPVPNGSSVSVVNLGGSYLTCQDGEFSSMPSGCLEDVSSCQTGFGEGSNYFCQSNWDGINTTENMVKCCSNLENTSDVCNPGWCAASTTTPEDICQSTMIGVCTADGWTNGTYTQDACDSYVTLQDSVGASVCTNNPSGENWNCAEQLIHSAVSDFYSSNSPTDNHPFVPKSIELCRKYPGLCNDVMEGVCKNYTLGDLDPSKRSGRTYDPDGTNLINACGCFMDSSQYTQSIPTNCNSICAFPGNIPVSGEGCSDNICSLDNITIDTYNSTIGSVNFNVTCGQCDGDCLCYFQDVDIDSIQQKNIQDQIPNNCSRCFSYDSSNPANTYEIPCAKNKPIPPTPSPSFLESIEIWIQENLKTIEVVGGSVVFMLILGFILLILLR